MRFFGFFALVNTNALHRERRFATDFPDARDVMRFLGFFAFVNERALHRAMRFATDFTDVRGVVRFFGFFALVNTNALRRERRFATDFPDVRGPCWIVEISQVVLLGLLDGFYTECPLPYRSQTTQKFWQKYS